MIIKYVLCIIMNRILLAVIISIISIFLGAGYFFYNKFSTLKSKIAALEYDLRMSESPSTEPVADNSAYGAIYAREETHKINNEILSPLDEAHYNINQRKHNIEKIRHDIRDMADLVSESSEDIDSDALLGAAIDSIQDALADDEGEADDDIIDDYDLVNSGHDKNSELQELLQSHTEDNTKSIEGVINSSLANLSDSLNMLEPEDDDSNTTDLESEVSTNTPDMSITSMSEENKEALKYQVQDTIKKELLLNQYSKKELIKLCGDNQLTKSGNKETLIEKLQKKGISLVKDPSFDIGNVL